MPDASTVSLPAAMPPPAPERTVRSIDPLDTPDWDRMVAAFPDATFFHGRSWAETLHRAYGYRPAYLGLWQGNALRAILPLMEVSSWLTGRRGVSLPFTDLCPPLAAEDEDFRALYRAARARGLEAKWRYLEVRGGERFGEVPVADRFYGHRLDLRAGEKTLLANCEGSVRRAIRKAGESGLEIEFAQSVEAVDAFHELLCLTRKRHGVPPQPRSFFRCIQQCVLARNEGTVVLARHAGRPVAGAVYFRFGTKVIYKYGASDERFQHLRANNRVMWEAIRRHADEGFAEFDFGRTAPDNEGLRKFKLGWGAAEFEMTYVRDNLRAGRFETRETGSAGLSARLFRRLPQPLLRLVGAALYRHVA